MRKVATEEVWLKIKKDDYGNQCKQSESCSQYEQLASTLETQSRPQETELDAIQKDMSSSSRSVSDLKRRIFAICLLERQLRLKYVS